MNRSLTLDKDNKLIPLLASKLGRQCRPDQFTFKLDPSAKFSDGSSVEAKDVKWSWERLKNLKGSASFLMDNVASIETPDAQTVVVKMVAPNSEFLNIAAAPYTAVVNSKVASATGAMADADAVDHGQCRGLVPSALRRHRAVRA